MCGTSRRSSEPRATTPSRCSRGCIGTPLGGTAQLLSPAKRCQAVEHVRDLNKCGNYLDRRTVSVYAWCRVHAMEMLERDPALTGADLTSRCQAQYRRAHQTTMEHRARSMMNDPAIKFQDYFKAIANKPDFDRMAFSSEALRNRLIGAA